MARANAPLPPGGTIGILGGGQLGRMLTMAAATLGFKTCIFTDKPDSPARDVAGYVIEAGFDENRAVEDFIQRVDVATIEFENIPPGLIGKIAAHIPCHPDARALDVSNDRLAEKTFIRSLDIATADFQKIDTLDDLTKAQAALGGAGILKTRRMGYDGKGQVKLNAGDDAAKAWTVIGEAPAILEALVPFERELSAIIARGRDGQSRLYDICENRHENHILATTTLPAAISPEIAQNAAEIARKIADALGFIGILTVELFLEASPGGGTLKVNEIAPRVHNSGHWTIDAALTSQFEQHIRAITGWPLGAPDRLCDIEMTNLIGDDIEHWHMLAKDDTAKLHIYGKAHAAPGRKMGHITKLLKR